MVAIIFSSTVFHQKDLPDFLFLFSFDNINKETRDSQDGSNYYQTKIDTFKICMIEVYLLKYYLKATSYINNAIIDKQS